MKQAMVFAAGMGTRLRPLTDSMPKALVRVGGQPLLWHVLAKLKREGFERIVVNVHHFAQQIVDYLRQNDNFGLDIAISDESDLLLDTGGGIKKARPLFDWAEPVLIHNVDILGNANVSLLYELTSEKPIGRPLFDAMLLCSDRTTKRYLLFGDMMHLAGWTNVETGAMKGRVCREGYEAQPALRRLAFNGVHVMHPQTLFPKMDAWPDRFSIIDFYLAMDSPIHIVGYEQDGLRWLDVGKTDTLQQAEEFINTL